jgi:hypothetical protein
LASFEKKSELAGLRLVGPEGGFWCSTAICNSTWATETRNEAVKKANPPVIAGGQSKK